MRQIISHLPGHEPRGIVKREQFHAIMAPAFKQLWPHFFHPDIKQDYWIAQLVELIKVFEGTSGTIANEDMLLELRDRIDKRLDTGEW